MTLTIETGTDEALGNGAATLFPIGFTADAPEFISVTYVAPDGTTTQLSSSDYTLTNETSDLRKFSITYTIGGSPIPSGSRLIFVRNTDIEQSLAFSLLDGFDPQIIENSLDRITMVQQENTRDSAGALSKSLVFGNNWDGQTALAKNFGAPVDNTDLTTKQYVDTSTAAAVTANNATVQGFVDSASASATAAEAARDQALAAFDNFDDKYLGEKATAPTTDNDGDPLQAGMLYYNTTAEIMQVYSGTAWVEAYGTGENFLAKDQNLSDLPDAAVARNNLGVPNTFNFVDYSKVQLLSDAQKAQARQNIGANENAGLVYPVSFFGAVGDGVTDDTVAVQAACTAAASTGGNVTFSNKTYRLGTIVITGSNVYTLGAGDFNRGTTIDSYDNNDTFVFDGCQHSGIQGIYVRGRNKSTGGFGLVFQNNCFRCYADEFRVDYKFNGILINGATETRLGEKLQLRYLLGVHGILFQGTAAIPSYRCIIQDFVADNPFPYGYGTVYNGHQSGRSHIVGDTLVHGGHVYNCSQAGTSGATAPSGQPGTDSFTIFSEEIDDGTVKWIYVARNSLNWIVQNSYGYSLVLDKIAAINAGVGYEMRDTANTGTSYPLWCFVHDLECDHSLYANVRLSQGEGFYATNSWWGSCLFGNGFEMLATYRGEVTVVNTRISYAYYFGVLHNAGPVDVVFNGNIIGDNGQAGPAGTYHGYTIGGGATNFIISNNKIGDIVGVGGNPQGWAVVVNTGNSDNYIISNNLVNGNVVGGIFDAGTGTSKYIEGNV